MTVVLAMRELLLQPFQLTLAMGAITRIQKDIQILETTNGLHGYGVGRGVEILLKERSAVEVHVMVAHDQETRVIFGLSLWVELKCIVGHSETSLPALVHHVAGMDGKDGLGVVALGGDVFVEAVVLALRHDAVALGIVRVGSGIDVVLVGSDLDDGFAVLGIVVKPVGHALFCVAAVDDHTCDVKTVTACSKDYYRCGIYY